MSWRQKIRFCKTLKSFPSFREVWIRSEICCWLNYPKRDFWHLKHRQLIPFCSRKLFRAHFQRKTSVVARLSNHKTHKSSIQQSGLVCWFRGQFAEPGLTAQGFHKKFPLLHVFHGIRVHKAPKVIQSDVTTTANPIHSPPCWRKVSVLSGAERISVRISFGIPTISIVLLVE